MISDAETIDEHQGPSVYIAGYVWAIAGVAVATAALWCLRSFLDQGQASLLYLPIVIVCATRFGFGPAVLAAVTSFLCWNYFFLPPYHSWMIANPKDWIALIIFMLVAVATARLASQARMQAQKAEAREAETAILQHASEEISNEVDTSKVLPVLARQIVTICAAYHCIIFRAPSHGEVNLIVAASIDGTTNLDGEYLYGRIAPKAEWVELAETTYRQGTAFGFSSETKQDRQFQHRRLGVYVPLVADGKRWGVLHVGPRRDRRLFNSQEERMILTLANHAAVALARQAMNDEATQAQALREADELKNTLLSLVSHELRTPLATIKASASGLLHTGGQWQQDALLDGLQSINDESDRLNELVSKLLDLSRLESGAWRPDIDWCDLIDVMGIALARLPHVSAERVQIVSPEELPLVRADLVQLAQVMTNLLENAIKYAPKETPIIVTLSEASDSVRIDVEDLGAGIPVSESEAIFDRFYRRAMHKQGGISGTGLGLTICRDIINAHGGRIWEHNAAQGGAIFSVELPRPEQAIYSESEYTDTYG